MTTARRRGASGKRSRGLLRRQRVLQVGSIGIRAMLSQGIYLAPSQFEAGFVSLAHTDQDVDATLEAARAAFASL